MVNSGARNSNFIDLQLTVIFVVPCIQTYGIILQSSYLSFCASGFISTENPTHTQVARTQEEHMINLKAYLICEF